MPPIVTIPPDNGSTTGKTCVLTWKNAHSNPTHSAVPLTNWRVTIGTDVGLNDKYDSGLLSKATLSYTCTSMPADNNYYYVQVEWTGSSHGMSYGNYFLSKP